ncbi:probable bifunctional dTTP/UTP pyrophosphatase/methyltransferase protein [Nematolebias whitei]|uniref:probable bifunctional dTTP/UTP pyrophosphatase/methyltransferase protein n=1 Tax=Nematolebias whitei TaxID=451745 RepID=UPI00189A9DCE|nr:probable bifunctional dTTP/UTP pyrophosphatase/methyltransferase protein [Nematolebias whitei]
MVLNPVISKLVGKLVVLASASPRRQEILRNVGLRFEVVPSWFKETLNKELFKEPHEYAVETARQKALEVARRMPFKHLKTPDMVIGADTIVTIDGMILEKPVDKHDAYRMLSCLSGKEHSVFTGVAVVLCHEKENEEVDYQLIDFYEETKVKFADLSEDMLWEYINSGEPMDKAGGYGIQALGGMLVEYVHGDFLNVVGFPLNHFCKQLDVIYNHRFLFANDTSESVRLIPNGGPSSPELTQKTPNSNEDKSNLMLSSPTASPAHKVKRKDGKSLASEKSWTLVDGLSKCNDGETKLHDTENKPSRLITSRKEGIKPEVAGDVDSEPNKDLQLLYELMDGFKASKALFTASKLCVFDLLHSKPGLDAEQVAQKINISVKGAECLLEACVPLGLLKTKKRTCSKPVYENTDLATVYLRSDACLSLHGYIQHCNDTLWPLFSHLERAVKEGACQRDKVKESKDECQDTVSNSQDDKLKFMKAMHSSAKVAAKAIAKAFDLSSYKKACDLGGCTGVMAYEFIKAHPELSVTVFDLPAVVDMTEYFHPQSTDSRVSFKTGDFFKDELPKADLYILVRILHDLTDEKLHVLLSKTAAACTPGGGLLLAEILLEEDRSGPRCGLLQALSMSEGKQRSAAEYSELLKNYGFLTTHVKHTNSLLGVMLCRKA